MNADAPVVHPAVGDAGQREWDTSTTATVEDALTELTVAANALADRVDRVPAGDWGRIAGLPGGGTVTALDLVRDAVRTGHDELRAAERALAAAR